MTHEPSGDSDGQSDTLAVIINGTRVSLPHDGHQCLPSIIINDETATDLTP